MSKVFGHNCEHYKRRFGNAKRSNGAYWYTEEIEKRIVPHIETDRLWVLYNMRDVTFHHAIVFVHNNVEPLNYTWLSRCKDLILVCGLPETCENMKGYGETLYLPLSIDVAEVEKHKQAKCRDVCYAGRATKRSYSTVNLSGVPMLAGMDRDRFLDNLAQYRQVYAVGRVALEAKVLGCEVLPFDKRFPDPDIWVVRDNEEVIPLLQKGLDEIEEKLR